MNLLEKISKAKINRPLTRADIHNLDNVLDKLFKDIGIDVNLKSKHFIKRIKERTKSGEISFDDLKQVFVGAYSKYKKEMVSKAQNEPGFNVVLQDLSKLLNVPIELGIDDTPNDDTPYELKAKTYIKKKDFLTTSQKWRTD